MGIYYHAFYLGSICAGIPDNGLVRQYNMIVLTLDL